MDLRKHLAGLDGHVDYRIVDALKNLDARLRAIEAKAGPASSASSSPVAAVGPASVVRPPATRRRVAKPAEPEASGQVQNELEPELEPGESESV
jgi:hypothetical protein